MESVLDTRLALLHLHLGGGPHLDLGDPSDQPGQPLLQLLPVPIGVGLLDLLADLLAARVDGLAIATAAHHRGVVLGDGHPVGRAEMAGGDPVQADADLLADHGGPGEGRQVLEHRLAAVAEAGGLDGHRGEGAAHAVDHQGGQRLRGDVLGHDEQGLLGPGHQLEHREQVPHGADLGVGDEDGRVVQLSDHLLLVGDQVRGDVAAVELHPLDHLHGGLDAVRRLDGDDTLLAHLGERVGEHLADLRVVGADGGDAADVLVGVDGMGTLTHRHGGGRSGGQHPLTQLDREGAGAEQAQPLVDHRPAQHGGGGGAVPGDVVGLDRDLAEELSPHVLEVVLEVEVTGDRDPVRGDERRSVLLVQDHRTPARAEGHRDGIGHRVHAVAEQLPRLGVESKLLSSHALSAPLTGDGGATVDGPCRHHAGQQDGRRLRP